MIMKLLFRKVHFWCTVLFLGISLGTTAQNAVKDTNPINDVMLQSFGWDEFKLDRHAGGFYNFYLNQADYLNQAGFDMIWLPPPSLSTGGVGYIPTQLHNFSQTAWGREAELKALLAKFKANGMYSLADVVVNHRGGTTGWTDFTNPTWSCKTIVSNDEAAFSPLANPKPCGNPDTGDGFDGGRDLDHTQQETRDGVKLFLTTLKGLGFDGWRWDVAKGFSAQYFGEYNAASKPYYSVGEYWDGNGQILKGWIDGTTKNSAAFDFSNYYTLTNALKWNSYGALNAGGRMPGVAGYIGYDDKAVTFVDNHDTFTKDEAILGDNIMKGYAYILTHAGVPCVWAAHYYGGSYTKEGVTRTYTDNQDAINRLIAVRKQNGINAYSSVNIVQSGGTYAAYISATFGTPAVVAVKLGGGNWAPEGSGWIMNASGTDYAVWSKKTITTPSPVGAAPISVGLVGIGIGGLETDWANDKVMTSTDNENYTLNSISLVGGAVKFRANAGWSLNWGVAKFPTGTAVSDGKDIPATAGTYKVTFNRKTGVFNFELIGEPCTCAPDTTPVCANGVEYANACTATCAGVTNFTVGKCPVVVDPCTLCTTEVAPVCANGVEYSNACKAECAGITNYTVGSCVVDPTFDKIGAIGTAIGGWVTDVDMTTTDGVTYKLMNQALVVGDIKFRQDDAWTINWGPSATAGVAQLGVETNMSITAAGNYNITFNKTTLAYSFDLVGDPIDPVDPVDPVDPIGDTKVGIIGTSVGGWVTDIDMTSTDGGITYTLKGYNFLDGAAKFRKDDAWTVNWGAATFPSGTGVQDGVDIPVVAGKYDVTFNATTGAYTFTLVGTVDPVDPVDPVGDKSVGIIGTSVGGWEVDVDMTSTDGGITYKLLNYEFVDGSAKFRKDDAWTVNWGAATFPSGTGVQDGVDIPVTAGFYDVSFNTSTGAYSFAPTLSRSDFQLGNAGVSIYPNPTTDSWNVSANETIVSVQILDAFGKTVGFNSGTSSVVSVNASNLSTGLYFAVVTTKNAVQTVKLIKG